MLFFYLNEQLIQLYKEYKKGFSQNFEPLTKEEMFKKEANLLKLGGSSFNF
jgi:hypothetical protein